MKKFFLALAILIVLSLACIYIFIPHELKISKITVIHCTISGAYRNLSGTTYWKKWWPGKISGDTSQSHTGFSYESSQYQLTKKYPYTIEINITRGQYNIPSSLSIISLGSDSLAVTWSCTYPVSSSNPFLKCKEYFKAREMKSEMAAIMEKFQSFIEIPANVYGMDIQRTSTKDTLLVAAKYFTNSIPSTQQVYEFLKPVKQYISHNGAMETGYPMMNVTKINNDSFQTMVAIPTNKILPGDKDIFFRRMIPGNFYVGEVKGGAAVANEALDQLQYFIEDYHKTIMAIPFQVFVTDRMLEHDSSKWITKIYMPVFN